jgi:hypothetical protein
VDSDATAHDQEAAMKIVDLQTTVVGTPWRELTFLAGRVHGAAFREAYLHPSLACPRAYVVMRS